MCSSQLVVVILMTTIGWVAASSDTCDKHLRRSEMSALINRTSPSCDQIDLSMELAVCQASGENTAATCYVPHDRLPALPACPDGTWNRTCYPRKQADMIQMSCMCHSSVVITGDVMETHWENWQHLDPPVNGAHYRRRLMMETECIAQEFGIILLQPIVKTHNLPDSVYTASSYQLPGHEAQRARIDNYFTICCGWAASSADLTNPWLAIALPAEYLIKGMMIKKRCDYPYTVHYVTMVTVTTSHDDVTYQDVVVREDLSAGYDADSTAYMMFSQVYTSRFWLIHVNAYNSHPVMKCDLLGIE